MNCKFIENHFTFQRNLVDENAFAIQDITLCNIHDQIPLHHYPLTYYDDKIILVQRNNEYFYILYSISNNSNKFYNFSECEKEEHDFELNNRYYKIDRYECSDLFVRIYLSTDKLEGVKYDYNAYEPRLILHNLESHFYCPNDAEERNNNSLESVVLMTINTYKPKVIDKLFCLMIFVKNCSYYLYCIQEIEKEFIRCNVIMSRHYYLSFYQLFSCDKTNKILKRLMNIEIENSKIVSLICEQLCSEDKQMENIQPEEHNCMDIKTIEFRPPINILDNLMHLLNPKTLIYILRAVFSEQKLVLLSTNADMLSLVTIAVKNCIHPFAYNNTTFSILPEDLSHMLEIPFPFIFGIIGTMKGFKSRKVPKEVLAIDLDSEEVNMKIRPKLPYEVTLENRLLSESWSTLLPRFFNMIQNNIDIAREKMIHSYINTDNLINIINNPKTILEKINNDYIDFYTRFFDTKIFQDYIFDQNECLDKVKLCLIADSCLITDVTAINHDVYKLWHYIAIQDDTENSLQIGVKDFTNAQKLVLLPYLFDIFSHRNDYDAIRELYKFLICNDIRITPDMYKDINRRTKGCSMVFYKFYGLSAYKIEVSQSLINNIDCKDGSFNLYKDDKKICTIRTMGVAGIYSEMRRRKCVSTKEVFMLQNPDLFWNIMFYFKLSNLPINLCDDSERGKRTDIDLSLHIKPTD